MVRTALDTPVPARVAVTGASGFIGRHLIEALRAAETQVVALSRGPVEIEDVEWRRTDVLDPEALAEALRGCEAVVHLAAVNKWGSDRARHAEDVNVEGIRNVLRAANLAHVSRLVFPSTGKVYRESAALPISEEDACEPTTVLGSQKLAGEHLVEAAVASETGPAATVLRIFNAYGPGQGNDFLIPRIIEHLDSGRIELGDLSIRRDFVHVTDIVKAILIVLGAPGDFAVYNVGSGDAVSVGEVVEAIREVSGRELEVAMDQAQVRPGEPQAECGATARLEELGWGPPMKLIPGLRTILDPRL